MQLLRSAYRISCCLMISLVILISFTSPSFATTWRVPLEHPTICGSVDSAAYGDTVIVEPGTYPRERVLDDGYYERVWIVMKDGVTLMSEGGPAVTELVEVCPNVLTAIVQCDSVSDAVIQGFTLRSDDCGLPCLTDGIKMEACKMTVEGNVIHGLYNGIYVTKEPPRPDRPIILGNEIYDCWMGIHLKDVWTRDSPRIVDNHISYCWEFGISSDDSDAHIEGNTIEHNGSYGLYFEGYSKSLLIRNRICYNGTGGVFAWMTYAYDHPSLNQTGYEENANDIYGNGGYAVYYEEATGMGLFGASLNYWGTLCPDSAGFFGRVDWTPWVDSTHTTRCYDCESCQPATTPTTWGFIKALFK